MKHTKLFLCLSILVWSAGAPSCKVENKLQVPTEPVKTINGSWAIIDATENGTDLMKWFDFSKFRITFTDSTYQIDSLLPFMVARNGKWSFNDPQYPFAIILTPTDSAAVSAPFVYPVVGGVRNMVITFSPGCPQNTYKYTLEMVNQ